MDQCKPINNCRYNKFQKCEYHGLIQKQKKKFYKNIFTGVFVCESNRYDMAVKKRKPFTPRTRRDWNKALE